MRRNLDMTALRSFVTTAEAGGVTRAATLLNLTQSAVSMQLKRLEESLNTRLFDRAGRGIALTTEGEQLLGYARRLVALNDEAVGRMTADEFEGVVNLGIPHDIVQGVMPPVLKRFNAEFPRMRVQFVTSNTLHLLGQFERGELDVIVTTEETCGADGETVAELPLVWVGATDGNAWKNRPLPIAFENHCIFRGNVQRRLDAEGISWSLSVDSNATRAIEATVSADLAVHAALHGMWVPGTEPIRHGGELPDLKNYKINIYQNLSAQTFAIQALVEMLREAYAGLNQPSAQPRPSRLTAVTG